ncbi:hypothetical protein [Clavibacter michiganensis]|uniref:hypothetical protein n=1 Tax=Clavibacter michiganensis TaxID=28447 RepID=UPI003756D089
MTAPAAHPGRPDPVDGDAFVAAVRRRFEATPSLAPEKTWVAGRASADGSAVILYSDGQGRLRGRRWVLERLAARFAPRDTRSLADAVYPNEVIEPDGPMTALDVDWADGLVEDPSRVGWVVDTWTHDDPPASG